MKSYKNKIEQFIEFLEPPAEKDAPNFDLRNVFTIYNQEKFNKYIGKIEVLGTNIFRISNSMDSDHSMDIRFTPTVYTPPENQLSAL